MWPLNIRLLAAASAFPAADHVGAPFFDFLPGDVEAHASAARSHVLRHLALLRRSGWEC